MSEVLRVSGDGGGRGRGGGSGLVDPREGANAFEYAFVVIEGSVLVEELSPVNVLVNGCEVSDERRFDRLKV